VRNEEQHGEATIERSENELVGLDDLQL
jgi:hypothetical protein